MTSLLICGVRLSVVHDRRQALEMHSLMAEHIPVYTTVVYMHIVDVLRRAAVSGARSALGRGAYGWQAFR